ncbi:MAG: 6-phosphofructokinase [Chloroflexota bacterium]
MTIKQIGLMTSGGDSPGMNAGVRAVVRTALTNGIKVKGIQRGYAGLLDGDIHEMDHRDVSGIIQRGGTILQTARCLEFKETKGQRLGLRRLNEEDIDALVVIGGDGSLRGALALHNMGFPVVGAPGSIDNDIAQTDMSIGVDTALNTILRALDSLRDTAASHERAFLVEVMGRSCGYLAIVGGILGGAEMVCIPESPFELEEVSNVVQDAYVKGKNHALIVVAEGAQHNVQSIAEFLRAHETGFDVRVSILGHIQRGGRPSAFDRMLATRLGYAAVHRLMNGTTGVMVGLRGRKIVDIPLEEATSRQRHVNTEYLNLFKAVS